MTLSELIETLKDLICKRFGGSIEIHFSQGGISTVIKHEKIK